jgi:Bacterial transglutaminase-like cysteine proteinase BTLCP
MGSFLSQPVTVVCRDMDEIRAFLSTCRYVSDRKQFGVEDHWMSPREFEQSRQGDCEDFALWTCRQLLRLGHSARFVVGFAGRYGEGHAWVSLRVGDQIFIVEPMLARLRTFPRLETLRYEPIVSVESTGSHVKFFEHTKRAYEPPLRVIAPLVPEWLIFRVGLWLRVLWHIVLWPYFALRRRPRRKQA